MFDDDDATCCAVFWCVALTLRGPALRLHGRGVDVSKWVRGDYQLPAEFEHTLRRAFFAGLIAVVWPCSLTFAAATGLTAWHQLMTLEGWGTSHSYWLVFACNLSLAAAASASFVVHAAVGGLAAGLGSAALTAAMNAAAPACVEAYAILMFFASLAKFNAHFFDARKSAASVHVLGAIEHLTAQSPTASRALRSLVDFAGLRVMESFFLLAAVGGALIEVAACALIYADYPWLWSWSAYLMHGFFSLTAFDFSVAVSGLMPLFGSPRTGAVAAWLGWTTTAPARCFLACALTHLVLHSGSSASTAQKGNSADNSNKSTAHAAKLAQLRFACQAWFALSAPPMYVTTTPPGALLLRLGSNVRNAAGLDALAALGTWGYGAVVAASLLSCGMTVLLGLAPYAGWRTAGSVSCLYSNLLVETRDGCNHVLSPLLRLLGMPWCPLVHDLVTVLASDAPSIATRLKLGRSARTHVFAGLVQASGGAYQGECYWHPTPPTWHLLLENADPDMVATPVLPYELPYFQLRVLISQLIATEPERDFYIKYFHAGQRRRFSRTNGRTHPKSDQLLAVRPPLLQRMVHCFRPLPEGARGPAYG